MDNKALDLALLNIVKTDDADVALGVGRTTLADFPQDILRRGCIKQWQLPHGPIVLRWIRLLIKFNGSKISIVKNILQLCYQAEHPSKRWQDRINSRSGAL